MILLSTSLKCLESVLDLIAASSHILTAIITLSFSFDATRAGDTASTKTKKIDTFRIILNWKLESSFRVHGLGGCDLAAVRRL